MDVSVLPPNSSSQVTMTNLQETSTKLLVNYSAFSSACSILEIPLSSTPPTTTTTTSSTYVTDVVQPEQPQQNVEDFSVQKNDIIQQQRNGAATVYIPTSVLEDSTSSSLPLSTSSSTSSSKMCTEEDRKRSIALVRGEKVTSRIEVNPPTSPSTECISAVTESTSKNTTTSAAAAAAAAVSSLEKDFHVVKIQISPTVNNQPSSSEFQGQIVVEETKHSGDKDIRKKCVTSVSATITKNISNGNGKSCVVLGPLCTPPSPKVSIVSFKNSNVSQKLSHESVAPIIDCWTVEKLENSEASVRNIEKSLESREVLDAQKSELALLTQIKKFHDSPTITVNNTSEIMVQKSSSNGHVEVVSGNPTYLYYMMTSGQCSPSDTLDSGTCSDMENGSANNSSQSLTPPPLPKKTGPPKLKIHLKNTKAVATENTKNGNGNLKNCLPKQDKQQQRLSQICHNRTGSCTDSEESESSLSCDSLNSSEFARNSSLFVPSPPPPPMEFTINGIKNQTKLSFLPDSLLRDIRDRKITKETSSKTLIGPKETIAIIHGNNFKTKINVKTANSLPTAKELREKSTTCVLITSEKDKKLPKTFDTDRYYSFHLNEKDQDLDTDDASETSDQFPRIIRDHDDAFAGYKDIHCNTSTIRSSKGTVRGVKNRVRNGIATFLQLQQCNVKNYKEKDSGKVVLYTTSMGIVRETYAKCSNVKQILRTLLVKFEERDVFMSNEYQQEIKERMQSEEIQVPQLFVEGQYIGDADAVERLNESGELRKMLKPYKSINSSMTCQMCGGYRLLPCSSCNGSKKSVHRNHFTAEFVALKCMNCDEVGLVKCHNC